MGTSPFKCVLVLISLFSVSKAFGVQGQEIDLCKSYLSEGLTPLVWTPQPLYDIELLETDQRVVNDVKFSQIPFELRDDRYIYLQFKDGRILYSPIYNHVTYAQSGKGLYTHKGLIRGFEDAEVLAAGEFWVIGGQIERVSNRSGNFRGPKERVALAISNFQTSNFPVSRNVVSVVVDPSQIVDNGHSPTHMDFREHQLQLRSEVMKHPGIDRILKIYQEWAKQIQMLESERSFESALDKYLEEILPHLIRENALRGLDFVFFPLNSATSATGTYWELHRGLFGKELGTGEGIPHQLDKFIRLHLKFNSKRLPKESIEAMGKLLKL